MSKVGEAPILIPSGVTVEKAGVELVVAGAKGELKLTLHPNISVEIIDGKVVVSRKNNEKSNMALHGLMRSLINNMIKGVTDGWSKNLELVGVGFRAQTSGDQQAGASGTQLTLVIGFSHPVEIVAPEGIKFEVVDNTKITVSGIDKYLVGQVAANIRKIKPPDVYKGKGIRYEGEYVRKKAGKAGKVGAGAVTK